MGIFQKIYNWIDAIKTPLWLKEILKQIQDVLVNIMMEIGRKKMTRSALPTISIIRFVSVYIMAN